MADVDVKFTKGQKGTLLEPDENGDIQMEGIGFTRADGVKCETEQDALISAMGGEVSDRSHKQEYNRQGQQAQVRA